MSNTQRLGVCPNTNTEQNRGVALMPEQPKRLKFELEPQIETGGGGMRIDTGTKIAVQEPNIPPQPPQFHAEILDQLNNLSKHLIINTEKKKGADLTMGQALDKFVEWGNSDRCRYKPRTVEVYNDLVQRFIKFMGGRDILLKDVTDDDITKYSIHLQTSNYAKSSIASMLISIKQFFKFLFLRRLNDLDFQLIEVDDYVSNSYIPVETEDAKKMIDGIKIENFRTLRDKTILSFLFESGLRVSELCDLKIGELMLDKGYGVIISKKNLVKRMVFWNKEAHELLEKYIKQRNIYARSEHLFITLDVRKKYKFKRISTRTIERLVKKHRPEGKEGIVPHSFRHALGMRAVVSGIHPRYIQQILGHKNLNSSQIYMDVCDIDVRNAYKKIKSYKPLSLIAPLRLNPVPVVGN